ncbi:hypothetical protein HNQ02_001793 [Flavobacterium sp. 7E]|uniref:HNH endonuclease n=1 Tax=unclassified Flavobacterium TaxID=196869 RepID=UPI001571530D|nr:MULTISPECIES: HNH endonuclease [unclassified Flavobacterium]NRS88875.1 hypothetical protein [Flavobacterium sp. 7E]NRT15828.1 hypothetical protein [Flavobacterium sp. 28A]
MEISFEKINSEIEKSSKTILLTTNDFKRQLNSTIYFVANKELNHWSISKEIACYVFNIPNVVDAKTFFYDNGFIDALNLEDAELEKFVTTKFLNWAEPFTNTVDIFSKLKKDREENNRIQLLIPIESLKGKFLNSKSTKPNFTVAIEGKEKFIKEYKYNSRHKKLVKDAKLKWKTNCWVCGFNFTEMYGDLGLDFIEIHHLIPISEGERESKVEDVRPVCSNCHRMIHKRAKMLTIQELKNIIEIVKRNKAST